LPIGNARAAICQWLGHRERGVDQFAKPDMIGKHRSPWPVCSGPSGALLMQTMVSPGALYRPSPRCAIHKSSCREKLGRRPALRAERLGHWDCEGSHCPVPRGVGTPRAHATPFSRARFNHPPTGQEFSITREAPLLRLPRRRALIQRDHPTAVQLAVRCHDEFPIPTKRHGAESPRHSICPRARAHGPPGLMSEPSSNPAWPSRPLENSPVNQSQTM
jgi:hypothetical protein